MANSDPDMRVGRIGDSVNSTSSSPAHQPPNGFRIPVDIKEVVRVGCMGGGAPPGNQCHWPRVPLIKGELVPNKGNIQVMAGEKVIPEHLSDTFLGFHPVITC